MLNTSLVLSCKEWQRRSAIAALPVHELKEHYEPSGQQLTLEFLQNWLYPVYFTDKAINQTFVPILCSQ
jgi:hypothetical protein